MTGFILQTNKLKKIKKYNMTNFESMTNNNLESEVENPEIVEDSEEILGGIEEDLKELDSRVIAVVEKLKNYKDVDEIDETNINEIQETVNNFGELDCEIREDKSEGAKGLISFKNSESGKMDEEIAGEYNKLVTHYEEIGDKIVFMPIIELYEELRKKIDIYKDQEQKSADNGQETLDEEQSPKSVEEELPKIDNKEGERETEETEEETMEEVEQRYKNERNEEVKEWRERGENENEEESKERKEEDIKMYKEKMERETERLLKEKETAEECIERLKEEIEAAIMERSRAAEKVQNELESGVDVLELSVFDQQEARKALGELITINRNNLNIAKLEYLLEAKKDGLGDLMDNHREREFTIEALERMAEEVSGLEMYAKELEEMGEAEKKEAQEEVLGFIEKLKKMKEENPEAYKALKRAGAIIGLLALAAALGMGGMAALGWLEAEAVVGIGGKEVLMLGAAGGAVISGRYLWKHKEKVAKGMGTVAGMGVGGLFMLASYLLDEKRRDDFMKKASGADLPWWYYSLVSNKEDSKK